MATNKQNNQVLSIIKLFILWGKENLAAILMLLALYLFISKSLYNVPMGVMAILGLYRTLTIPGVLFKNNLIKIFCLLFLCIWTPMLLSLIDAFNPGRSAQTVFPYLRFLFVGIYIIHEFQSKPLWEKLNLGIFIIISFWCLDALIQYFFGIDLFGYPHLPGHIHGVFYPEITIGHVTAALSPLYFHTVYTYGKRFRWLWLLLLPLFMVILLSGRRAAWIMLIVSMAGYALYLCKMAHQKMLKRLVMVGAAFFFIAVLIIINNTNLKHRIETTEGLFSSDFTIIDKASAYRLTLWRTAFVIFQDNWICGIGPRGFRYVYTRYSDPGNPFHETGQTHPHQLVLEVLAETGLIGFTGLMLFVYIFYRFLKRQRLGMAIYPWWLAMLVATFPLNTHMAFYGSYWSSLFWWLTVLSFAACAFYLSTKHADALNKV